MTGSTHAEHRSARSPRPTPQGPARDSPVAGPRTGTMRSEPSAPASAGAGDRHNEPGSRPASACPTQPPSKAGGASPRVRERHHGDGEADPSTESNPTGRGATHQRRGHEARQRGRPQATTKAQGKVPSNNGHQVPQTRAASATRNEPRHRNRCQEAANPHTTNPGQEWRSKPKPEPEHTHPQRTPQPGEAGYRGSTHTSTHTPLHPSQEWRGAAETGAQTHTPRPHTQARSGGVQGEHARQHPGTPTPQPGVAGHSQNPSPSTHTHNAHPSQEWRGTGGACTPAHTHPNTPARSGGAQPKPEPKHAHARRTPQPGVAGYRGSTHSNTHTPTPQPGLANAAETRAQAHTRTPQTPARSGRLQGEHAHQQAHLNTPARRGGAQPKPEPKHTHPRRTP